MAAFKPFSPKQLLALTWWCKNSPHRGCDAVICDGAVRSGKTLCLSVSFVAWSFSRFENQTFAFCGRTIGSLRRNVIAGLPAALEGLGFACDYKPSRNYLDITHRGRTNRFYLFGGKDEGSASLIQGITLAGVLFDEVALMPRSFVEQALARCSVTGSKFWFNCNPEHPYHWFYREWILRCKEKSALYLHFTMEDNPSLTPEIRARYESLYSGSFYERFVRGRWVAPSGLVYPMFDHAHHVATPPPDCERFYISCDYGTLNPTSMGLWGQNGGVWYRIREYYHNARATGVLKTDEEYYQALERLAGGLPIQAVVVDPSAASFIEAIRRHGRFTVLPAKNDVLQGIRRVSDSLKAGQLRFAPCCTDTLREFSLYRWDENARSDCPVKEHDHAMDDIRYFVYTILSGETREFYALSAGRGGPVPRHNALERRF